MVNFSATPQSSTQSPPQREVVGDHARAIFAFRIRALQKIINGFEIIDREQDRPTFFEKACEKQEPLALFLRKQFQSVAFCSEKSFDKGDSSFWDYLAEEYAAASSVQQYLKPLRQSIGGDDFVELPQWLKDRLGRSFQGLLGGVQAAWYEACNEYLRAHGAKIGFGKQISRVDMSYSSATLDNGETLLPAITVEWSEHERMYTWTGVMEEDADGATRTTEYLQETIRQPYGTRAEKRTSIDLTLLNDRNSKMTLFLDFAREGLNLSSSNDPDPDDVISRQTSVAPSSTFKQ